MNKVNSTHRPSQWYAPAATAVLLAIAFSAVLWTMHKKIVAVRMDQLVNQAESAREYIHLSLKGNEDYLLMLAKDRAKGILDRKLFQEKGSQYINDHPEMICINWVEKDFRISDVAPLAPNKHIVGLYLDLPEPKLASQRAKDTRKPVYTKPFKAIQGGLAFEVWVPVFQDNTFLGLLGGIYSWEKVLHALIPPQLLETYQVSLLDTTGRQLLSLAEKGPATPSITTQVSLLPEGIHELLQLSTHETGSLEPNLIFLAGICLSLIFGMLYAMWRLKCEANLLRSNKEMLQQSKTEQENNNRLLRSIMDNTFQLRGLLSPDGKLLDANATALKMINASKDSILGRDFWDTPWWDSNPELKDKIRQAVGYAATGRLIRFETVHIDTTGKSHYIDFSLRPFRNDTGDIIYLLPEGHDITERKQTEKELQRQACFQELLINMSMTYINLPLEKVESSVSASLQEMGEFVGADRSFIYEYDFEKQIGSMTHEWVAEETNSRIAVMHKIQLADIPDWDSEKHRRGELIWIPDASALPQGNLRNLLEKGNTKASLSFPLINSNECLGFVGFAWAEPNHTLSVNEQHLLMVFATLLMNIRQRKLADEDKIKVAEQLKQSQKMEAIGTLAGGIAHDFNNILTPIFGYAEFAMDHLGQTETLQTDLEEILIAAGRARALVRQILTFSRKNDQEKQPFRMSLIVKEAVKLLRASIPSTIEIKQEIISHKTILADPTQIHQVIMNLCTNAYHAMRNNGGILTIALKDADLIATDFDELQITPGTYLQLQISDTGHGMDKQTLKKIFEPYFTTKDIGEGTGLGLAVVHGIIKGLHGTIHAHSEPDQGTSFYVYLPIVDEQTGPLTPQEEKEILTGGKERILVVDDDEKIVNMIREILTDYGYKITAFQDSIQAMQEFEGQPMMYDLVITDMTMPNMTGVQLARNVMEIRPGTPVILCTGYSDLINREKALAMGIKEYVEKPLTMSKLVKIVRSILNREKSYDI